MDVMVGSTFAYAGDRPTDNMFFAGDSSESESSIGTPDDSDIENVDVSPKRNRDEEDDDDEDGEVQSEFNGLNSLDSLEDSLPIKKGLSNHFIGKSKSFTNLSEVTNVKELQKQENPFNKRRRVLIASKWSKKSSFYSCFNPKSMPFLPVDEDQTDEDDHENGGGEEPSMEEKKSSQEEVMMRQDNNRVVPHSYASHMRHRLGSFKSRSYSLADLQEHDEVEDEDEDN